MSKQIQSIPSRALSTVTGGRGGFDLPSEGGISGGVFKPIGQGRGGFDLPGEGGISGGVFRRLGR